MRRIFLILVFLLSGCYPPPPPGAYSYPPHPPGGYPYPPYPSGQPYYGNEPHYGGSPAYGQEAPVANDPSNCGTPDYPMPCHHEY
jgi:hypothetical protein